MKFQHQWSHESSSDQIIPFHIPYNACFSTNECKKLIYSDSAFNCIQPCLTPGIIFPILVNTVMSLGLCLYNSWIKEIKFSLTMKILSGQHKVKQKTYFKSGFLFLSILQIHFLIIFPQQKQSKNQNFPTVAIHFLVQFSFTAPCKKQQIKIYHPIEAAITI